MEDSATWKVPSMDWRGWLWLAVLCAFAAFIRVWHVSQPYEAFFDEIYYGPAALDYIEGRPDSNTVHPPLGKLQIAAGILALRSVNKAVGQEVLSESVQRRCTSVVCGVLMVFFTFLLGHRVSRGRRDIALLAAFFVSIDFMAFTMSRICMLDMVNSLWILIGAYCCWRYLEECWSDGQRSWLWAWLCALAMAIATACKWNGLFAAGGCWLAMVSLRSMGRFSESSSETAAVASDKQADTVRSLGKVHRAWSERKREQSAGPRRSRFVAAVISSWREGWRVGIKLGLLMALCGVLVYIMSYLPLFMRLGWGSRAWKEIWGYHALMFAFRYDAKQFTHSYLSYFWEWPLVLRPVWLYFESNAQHTVINGIVAFGSVLFWWPGLVYLAESGYYGVKECDAAKLYLVGMWLVQWLLWSSSTTGGFIYYMLPGVPMMALVAALVIGEWCDGRVGWMAALYLAMLTLAFIAYWPFLSGEPSSMPIFNRLFPGWMPRWR